MFRVMTPLMEWVFDAIIFTFLTGGLAAIFILSRDGERWLNIVACDTLIVLIGIAWAVVFYGSFIEPQMIRINQQTLDLGIQQSNYLHVAVISDFQAGRYKGAAYMRRVVDTLIEAHPDVVLLLGDYVSFDSSQADLLAPFKDMTTVYPTYAILGNHDYQLGGPKDPANKPNADGIAQTLSSFGIHVLRNEGAEIGDGMYLAGIEELWTHHADVSAALAHRSPTDRTILLSHNPDIVKQLTSDNRIDLVLSGHTHGGQIRLPWLGSVPPIPDELGRAYDKGWFTYGDQTLFITSGIGESGPRARLFNPPEIVSLFIRY